MSHRNKNMEERPKSLLNCFAKNAYESRAFALCAAICRMGEGGPPLRVYQCEWCNMWHMTKLLKYEDSN